MKITTWVCLWLVAAVGLLSGCSDGRLKTATVKGTITYKGKPVPFGTVNFHSSFGPVASGELQPDGTYSLTTYVKGDGAVPGEYKVFVVALGDLSSTLPETRNPLPPPAVPEIYISAATSPLRAEVKDGPNTFDFNLEGSIKR